MSPTALTARSAETVGHRVASACGIDDGIPWRAPCSPGVDARHLDRDLSELPAGAPASLSVIVPSFGSEASIAACVAALARAADAVAHRCSVEVVVVDDASQVPVAGVLADAPAPCGGVRVLRVEHGGQSRATNAGALVASGEALVLCDSDMVVHAWALDQLLRALTASPGALVFGFRENAAPDDPRLGPERLARDRPLAGPLLLADDNRLSFDVPGYPSSLVAATRELSDLQGGRRIRPPGRLTWSLPTMAYGCLLACRRERFLSLGGFDGAFTDWGFADTELAARWIARGGTVRPQFTASALHIAHAPRSPLQWRRFATSRRRYEQVLAGGWRRPEIVASPVQEDRRVAGRAIVAPVGERPEPRGLHVAARAAVVGDLSLFQDAAGDDAVTIALGDGPLAATALGALRRSGALDYLACGRALDIEPTGGEDALERALLAVALDAPDRATALLERAAMAAGNDWLCRGRARWLGGRRADVLWSAAQRDLAHGLPRAAASRLLSCRVAAGPRPAAGAIENELAMLDRADRRLW